MYRILPILLILPPLCADAQEKSRFNVDAGITLRRNVLYFQSTSGTWGRLINSHAPYNSAAGIDGLGLNTTLTYLFMKDLNIRANLGTTVRYDSYKIVNDRITKTWYFDQSISLTKGFKVRYHRKLSYVGFGLSLINIGKELHYTGHGGVPKTLQLHFDSYDLIAGTPIWKLYFESKFSGVSDDFPGPIKQNATLLTLRLYYRFLE